MAKALWQVSQENAESSLDMVFMKEKAVLLVSEPSCCPPAACHNSVAGSKFEKAGVRLSVPEKVSTSVCAADEM